MAAYFCSISVAAMWLTSSSAVTHSVASLIFPSMHTLFPFLDRSWARRARGGGAGTKKRPELLNADFYGDRERPGSPSPGFLVEKTTSEEDIKPKYV